MYVYYVCVYVLLEDFSCFGHPDLCMYVCMHVCVYVFEISSALSGCGTAILIYTCIYVCVCVYAHEMLAYNTCMCAVCALKIFTCLGHM
jgi:hypothetical protein